MKLSLPDRMLTRSAALAAILLAFGFAATASAATDKSGMIAGQTWTPAMSPIRVVGDITVANLTIQPGVEVLFTGNFEFDCPGVLHAAGNAANKIWFHGDTGITWKGLNFLNSADGSVLEYCIVENSNDRGIAVTNSGPTISNCVIKNNTASVSGGGIYIKMNVSGIPALSLSNCEIMLNSATTSGGGIYIEMNVSGTPAPFVSDCNISNNTSAEGGGAEIVFNSSATMVLSRCVISNNMSTNGVGGGARVKTSSSVNILRFTDCQFTDNMAATYGGDSTGGGAYFEGPGQFFLLRCPFRGNQTISDTRFASGGGLVLWGGTLSLRNCDFQNNRAIGVVAAWSGGIHFGNGHGSFYNCLIRENIVDAPGISDGGMRLDYGTCLVENCAIVNNSSTAIGSIYASLTIRNSIIFSNNANGTQIGNGGTTAVSYSDVQNGYTGTGNITTNPLLNSDYTLNAFSSCVDKGDPDSSYNDLVFYNATSAPWGSHGTARNDMGAYGGPGAALWEPGSGPPRIASQSGGGLYGVADAVQLTAGVSGLGPFTYVWKKNGVTLTDSPPHITGATTGTLAITNAVLDDGGIYTVEVTSPYGGPATKSFTVAVDPLRVNVKMFAGVIIQATPGTTVRVEYSNDLSPGSWNTLTQLVVPSSPYTYYDTDSPNHGRRFYRAIEVP